MKILNFLKELGLTEYEAKVLTAMLNLKKATAIKISSEARIPKTRVYDILDSLVEKKLVLRLAGKPKSYQIVSPEAVFNTLLEEKRKKLQMLSEEAKRILKTLSKPLVDRERVIKLKNRDEFYQILAEEFKKAKQSIIGFAGLEKGYEKILPTLKDFKDKNIDIRLLYHTQHMPTLREFQKSGIKMKTISTKLEGFLIDDSTVIMPLNDFSQESDEYHIGIWNNSPIAKVLKHYFEKHW
ncbi:MAG: hypothetical protein DRO04_01600 [Candidatus Iainarchaeum archaeon]|uniref:Transcription regulator TrmB N-terminal domain-containing protein n=1 Tax=Candidatus Iainarchaeum sp. TaxID=3101447 RepID=A0A497JI68_9ARCH|nr:MAG: hypothetical protein DRO04_01600 [Candidatus Diapherotrites archaeon]